LAEIVLRHAGQEPHPALFTGLSTSLDQLAQAEPETLLPTFLRQAWQVVGHLGFAPVLDVCTTCGRPLSEDEMAFFDLASGGVRCGRCSEGIDARRIGPVARAQLAALMDDTVVAEIRKPEAHLSLLDDFVTFHMLGGRRLQSFQFLGGTSK
jgi:recombinational DNA repair protein (RecF pathway)